VAVVERVGDMALVEKSPFRLNPPPSLGVDLESAKRRKRILFSLMSAAAIMAVVVCVFTTGHPIAAIWMATAFVAWLFVRGAAESD